MRVVQAVWGVFHHFDLARELEQRGHLQKVYSTFPWARLKREGISHSKVETFPWLHMAAFAVGRCAPGWRWGSDALGYTNTILFDKWLNSRLPSHGIDALIALSGAGLNTGQRLQKQGGIFICDRGSTHQRVQTKLLQQEFKRWNFDLPQSRFADALCDREVAMYEAANAVTVPSTFAARSFIDSGIAKEKVHVIPYGVRLDKFQKVADPPRDRFEVLFVGSVSLRKGIPYLLQAFAQLSHPNKRLRVIGAVQSEITPLLNSLPQDGVEYLGPQPQVRVRGAMSGSHVLVLPSIEDGFGLVQAQAMACGCPVIASTNTGGEDLFVDGQQGFIVNPRDAASLRDRMQQLADDPALQQQMSQAALEKVKQIGGWNLYGDRWVELLGKLGSHLEGLC
jgi:glycosyltransferase involved in cell wall biosynthesis